MLGADGISLALSTLFVSASPSSVALDPIEGDRSPRPLGAALPVQPDRNALVPVEPRPVHVAAQHDADRAGPLRRPPEPLPIRFADLHRHHDLATIRQRREPMPSPVGVHW